MQNTPCLYIFTSDWYFSKCDLSVNSQDILSNTHFKTKDLFEIVAAGEGAVRDFISCLRTVLFQTSSVNDKK